MSQHILIVEDDVMIQGFLTLTLEGEGYRTSAVGSGSGMFSVLRHEKVDLILLDLGLPDSDGLDLTEEIRKTQTVPIIVASARRRSEDREAALALGANDYLTKPFEPRELIRRVKYFLSGDYINVASSEPPSIPGSPAPEVSPQPRTGPSTMPEAMTQSKAPIPDGPQPSAQLAPVSLLSWKPDNMVMLLGGLVVVAAVAGGTYWYVDRMGGENPFAGLFSPNSVEQAQEVSEPRKVDTESSRRGALQPPAPDPVRIAQPPETVSEAENILSEPVTRPTTQPAPKSFTESVVVRPQTPDPLETTVVDPPDTPAVVTPEIVIVRPACPQIPNVDWWRFKTHAQIKRFVDRKHGGDWQPYVDGWVVRLEKLRDIYDRGSAIKTGNGELLQDEDLAAYINQVAKRVAVTKCLAEQAITEGN